LNNIVVNWFGESFQQLDPLIQQLHSGEHAALQGEVELKYGNGLAGFIGKRIGVKLGLPPTAGAKTLRVDIESNNGQLIWSRAFDSRFKMESIFEPQGTYPDGYWREATGVMKMDLGVQIKEGGWYWQQKKIWFKSIPLPLGLFPYSHAYKKIENGLYEFSVFISLPVLGELISYSGRLNLVDDSTCV